MPATRALRGRCTCHGVDARAHAASAARVGMLSVARGAWQGRAMANGMDRAFWQQRWDSGSIGFHQAQPTRYLVRHAERFLPLAPPGAAGEAPPRPARVLVPLAGKTLDMAWLAARGHEVVGVELIERAVLAFFEEHGLTPARAPAGKLERFTAGAVTLLCGDFFDAGRDEVGRVDAAFDRAALVALPAPLRERYARHLSSLLEPGARILLVAFEYDQHEMQGPPFAVDGREVERLFGAACSIELLERHFDEQEAARFRERGITRIAEAAWLLTVRADR